MPEYLHPGVYIEETSYRGVPIEGVSTSTAGLVGATTKGPEGKPTLVTSFADFQRTFGAPFPITPGVPVKLGYYLGHAVRAFFDNGGLRAYIVRTLAADAQLASLTGGAGIAPLLAPNKVLRASATPVDVPLVSTRGIAVGDQLHLYVRPDASSAFVDRGLLAAITAVDPLRNTVTLPSITSTQIGGSGAPSTITAIADNLYFLTATAPVTTAATVPVAKAKYRGDGGNALSVQFRAADRTPVKVAVATTAAQTVQVASTNGFYVGAIVEIVHTVPVPPATTPAAPAVTTIDAVDPSTKTLKLDTAMTLTTDDYIRVLEIDVLVSEGGALRETFSGLTWNDDPSVVSRYYVARINDPAVGSQYITMTGPTSATADLTGQPVSVQPPPLPAVTPLLWYGLAATMQGGDNGSDLADLDLIGTDLGPGKRTGIQALIDRTDIALVAVPGVTDIGVQAELLTHCENQQYRFAVLDGELGVSDTQLIASHRNHYDSHYGGYYTPWLETLDLSTGNTMYAPPSGYVLGICARVDNDRGVWKAPANEVVQNVLDVQLPFGNGESDVLNPQGVNLIRAFEGRGIRVWGGRCTTGDTEWKYVNVRRLFIYLEHSIDLGTQWVVFEPNNESLWKRVVQTIDAFLFGVWKAGALMGTKPEEAYFVRCDRTTMTQDDIDNGRLICQIGIAPAYPAEFVIFQIGQATLTSS